MIGLQYGSWPMASCDQVFGQVHDDRMNLNSGIAQRCIF